MRNKHGLLIVSDLEASSIEVAFNQDDPEVSGCHDIFLDVKSAYGDNAWMILSTAAAERLRDHLSFLLDVTPVV